MPPVPRQIPCIAEIHTATTRAYRLGCSCPGAREAWRLAAADYKSRRRDPSYRGRRGGGPTLPVTPAQRAQRATVIRERNQRLAVGARRKLRALMRIGHGRPYLAQRLEMSLKSVSSITGGSSQGGIWPRTATAVDELYQELRYTLGDNLLTAVNAERLGYLPPQAWDGVDINDLAALPRRQFQATPRSATA